MTISLAPRMLVRDTLTVWWDEWSGWCAIVPDTNAAGQSIVECDDLAEWCEGRGVEVPTDAEQAWCRE
jgi:hypothetical protein